MERERERYVCTETEREGDTYVRRERKECTEREKRMYGEKETSVKSGMDREMGYNLHKNAKIQYIYIYISRTIKCIPNTQYADHIRTLIMQI